MAAPPWQNKGGVRFKDTSCWTKTNNARAKHSFSETRSCFRHRTQLLFLDAADVISVDLKWVLRDKKKKKAQN